MQVMIAATMFPDMNKATTDIAKVKSTIMAPINLVLETVIISPPIT
jgi:hypothetical protein